MQQLPPVSHDSTAPRAQTTGGTTLSGPLLATAIPVSPIGLLPPRGRRGGRPYADHDRETPRDTAEMVSCATGIGKRTLGAAEEVTG